MGQQQQSRSMDDDLASNIESMAAEKHIATKRSRSLDSHLTCKGIIRMAPEKDIAAQLPARECTQPLHIFPSDHVNADPQRQLYILYHPTVESSSLGKVDHQPSVKGQVRTPKAKESHEQHQRIF